MSELARKLQLRPGRRIAVVNAPADMTLDLAPHQIAANPETADGVLLFARNSTELVAREATAVEAGRRDALAWIAYPKGGRLETDLNRDRLADAVKRSGLQPVRQIALDDVWSALRFRPNR